MKANRNMLIIIIVIGFIFQLLTSEIVLTVNNTIKTSFPRELQTIEEEAFSGTALERVVFGDELLYIGDRAFQDNFRLSDVYIPASVCFIGDMAFPDNIALTVNGIQDSYAQKWAESNHVLFVANDIWSSTQIIKSIHLKLALLLWIFCVVHKKTLLRVLEYIRKYIKSMRPQDRPELHPINYRFP